MDTRAKAKSGCLDIGYSLVLESARFARHLTAGRQLGLWVAILLLMGPVCRINAQEIPEELAKFLKDRIALTGKELLNVDRGEAIAKVLRSEGQEVAVFGIVRVNVPENFFLERF